MQHVTAYPHLTHPAASKVRLQRLRSRERASASVRLKYLSRLANALNFMAGAAFLLAAAFASQFILITTFWQGVLLGALIYGLFMIVGSACLDV